MSEGWKTSKEINESGDEGACGSRKVAEPNLEMSKSQESDSGVSKDGTCGFAQLAAIFSKEAVPPKVPLHGRWHDNLKAGPSRDSVFYDRKGWGFLEDDGAWGAAEDAGSIAEDEEASAISEDAAEHINPEDELSWKTSKEINESGDEGACGSRKVAEPNLEMSKSQESDSGVSKDGTCGFAQLAAIFSKEAVPPKVPLHGRWRDNLKAGPSRDSVFYDRKGWGFLEDDGAWGAAEDAGSIAEDEEASAISKDAVEHINPEDEFHFPDSEMHTETRTDSKRLVEIDNVVRSSKRLERMTRVLEQEQAHTDRIMTKEADETVLSAKEQKLEEDEEEIGASSDATKNATVASPDATKNATVAQTQIQKNLRRLKYYCEKDVKLRDKIDLTQRQIGAIDTLFKAITLLDTRDIRAQIRLAQPALKKFKIWKLKQDVAKKTLKKTQTLLEMMKTATRKKGATAEFRRSVEKCEVFLKEEFDFESNEDRIRLLVEKSDGKPSNIWFPEEMRRYSEQKRIVLELLNEVNAQCQLIVNTWLDKRVAHAKILQAKAHKFFQKLEEASATSDYTWLDKRVARAQTLQAKAHKFLQKLKEAPATSGTDKDKEYLELFFNALNVAE